MAEEKKTPTRTVAAPLAAAPMGAGEVLTVEVGADEDIEWIFSHDPGRGSRATGYRIVPGSADP